MSRRTVGILLLLVASEVLGVLSGHWYFGVYNRTVPPAMVTEFNSSAAHVLFLWRGLLLGLGIFLLGFLALLISPWFRIPPAPPAGKRPGS